MAYNSAHTGPEIDAAVQLLGQIQEARDSTSQDLSKVKDLASQVKVDAAQVADQTEAVTSKASQVSQDAAVVEQARQEVVGAAATANEAMDAASLSAASALESQNAASISEQAAASSQLAAGLSEQVSAESASEAKAAADQVADDRKSAAESAASAAASAQNAEAVVTGGTASVTPGPGLIPLADAEGRIEEDWLPPTVARTESVQSALEVAERASDAAAEAQARAASFLLPSPEAPVVRDHGAPLQIGDRYFNSVEQAEFIYMSAGWALNDSLQAIDDLKLQIVEDPTPSSIPRSGADGKIDPGWVGDSLYDYLELRAYVGKAKRIRITKPGIDGWFRSRGIITGFSDNGGTYIIGQSGHVWERIYSGPVSVLWFDCPLDGVTNADIAFAKFTSVLKNGEAIIPPLKYAVTSINFKLVGQSPTIGGLKVYAYGATIVGECVIRVDSCKRLRIEGIEGFATDLQLNGAWYLNGAGVKLRDILLSAATGTQFSSNYWNAFVESQFQSIVTSAAGTQGNNQFRWSDCQFRGDASQGYTSTRDYFIQFLANQDAQSWTFEGCDISYYLVDMFHVADSNSEDIQLDFQNCYFDSKYPSLASRPKTRLTTDNCQAANDMPNSVRIGQACRGSQDAWRSDRAAGWKSYSAFNLIPNGDLYDRLSSYVGASLPILSANSAVVTALTGAGQNGNYLNINQSLTTSNQVRFRPKNLPFTARYTGVLVMRNAAGGAKSVRVSVGGLYFTAVLSSSEWSIITLTTGVDLVAGSTTGDILLLTDDSTGFNVDVCYIGMFAGENLPMFLPSAKPQSLYASATWDPPSIAAGSQTTLNVPVPGSASGDFCLASFSNPLQGLQLSASYLGSETIQVVLRNGTSSAIDLANGILRVKVEKNTY